MSKCLQVVKFFFILLVSSSLVASAPRPQALVPSSALAEAEVLETGAAAVAEKDVESDLEGSSSFGHGYYSSPFGGHYGGYGGYYPYYGGGYGGYGGYGGLGGGYYGLGYPYYGGYYGYHGLHGHYY